jgi:hypothetical protein
LAWVCAGLAAGGGTVPAAVVKAMDTKLQEPAYLPATVPGGYRYVSWKDFSPSGAPISEPSPAPRWYQVVYRGGAGTITWTVGLASEYQAACNSSIAGHKQTPSGTVDWNSTGLVWMCLNDKSGHTLVVSAASKSVARPTLVSLIGSATAQ